MTSTLTLTADTGWSRLWQFLIVCFVML